MILITLLLILAIVVNLGLGTTVYLTNRARKANQSYLVATIFMSLWLSANLIILHSTSAHLAHIGIDAASALSVCIPTTFQLLRLTIKFPNTLGDRC